MARKLNLIAAVQEAAASETPRNRFQIASETVAVQPTGFSPEIKASESSPGVAPQEKASPAGQGVVSAFVHQGPLSGVEQLIFERVGAPRYEEWPIDLIDDNPYNARTVYLPESVSQMADSIRQVGQIQPAAAAVRGDRRVLAAGHYRKLGLQLAGVKTMKLLVYDSLSDRDLYLISNHENSKRNTETAYDNACVWTRLLENKVYKDEDDLAQSIGCSRSTVNKTLSALRRLDPRVLLLVKQMPARFALTSLYELTLLQDVAPIEQVLGLAEAILMDQAGRQQVMDARARIAAGANPKPIRQTNETSRQYRIFNNKSSKIGYIKEWDSGKVAVEMQFEDAQKQEEFVLMLRERFGLGAGMEPNHSEKRPAVVNLNENTTGTSEGEL